MIPNPIVDNVGTFLLSGEVLNFIKDWGVKQASFYLVSGSATYTGSFSLGARNSDVIIMTSGVVVNISGDIIDGFSIDATGGDVLLIARR